MKNSHIRFTIITITYNAAPYLERTILSVLGQSCAGIGYIIIDGGSTDGTVEIIRRYDSGISYWVSERDSGLYDAMNKGLAEAKGDYVWFINAGDYFYSADTVREIASAIAARAALPDIIYGETMLVDERGERIGMRKLKAPENLSWKSFRMGMKVCHQSFVVRRAIAPKFDLQYKYSSDFDWCIRVMKRSKRFFNTKSTLSCYMEGGLSVLRRKASLRERYNIMCRYYGVIPTALRHIWFAIRFYFLK